MDGGTIQEITGREIYDCRLEPTLRVEVETTAGIHATADVPAGRSTGKSEVHELRDGNGRLDGLGVHRAIEIIREEIAPILKGMDPTQQAHIDEILAERDGTDQKTVLGGNTICGISLAVLKAGAASSNLPLYRYVSGASEPRLPIPWFDLIEGGELAATDLAFQEHQVIPVGADSFTEALEMCAEVYYELGDILAEEWGESARNVGYEGGYTPAEMTDPREAFDAELQAIEERGYGGEFALGIDVAASHLFDSETETYRLMDKAFTRDQLIAYYEDLVDSYPIISIEDPLEENDFEGYTTLTDALDVQIIGDDLFVTNSARLRRGITENAANALLLKVNQIGTVSEALKAAEIAQRAGYAVQVSERSGQTPDTWLADLAVGVDGGQIKTGVSRGERTEQYNRLLEIEAEMDRPTYASWSNT